MLTPKQNGDSAAFPCGDYPGMTLRELFAGMALQGLLASYTGDQALPDFEDPATEAACYADYLLVELAKENDS